MSESPKRPTVYVVDDEFVIAWSLAMILRHHGFAATSYTNPLQALQDARSATPDILISDVVMPQLSGIDLAIQVQDRSPDCQVLLLSGQAATAKMLESAAARGANFEILLKPVRPADLLTKLQNMNGMHPVAGLCSPSLSGAQHLYQI